MFLALYIAYEITDAMLEKHGFNKVSREVVVFLLFECAICVDMIVFLDGLSSFDEIFRHSLHTTYKTFIVYFIMLLPFVNALEHFILIYSTVRGVCSIAGPEGPFLIIRRPITF